jgi:lipopolysaccharide transport system permease protein
MAQLSTLRFRLELLKGLVWREVLGRYRGSFFGIVWSLIAPLMMLGIYTFAFHDLFGARWPGVASRHGFATMLFAGLVVHGLIAECLTRAPVAITANPSFVKKIVFPLTVLPLVAVGSAIFHAVLGLLMLGVVAAVGGQHIAWTAVFVPLVLFPFVILLCGLSWMLAAIGVYIRDIAQLSGMISTILLFLSPAFIPESAMPAKYAAILHLNPITLIIIETRAVLFDGRLPDFGALAIYLLVACLFSLASLLVFRKLRRGFGDIL